MNMHVHNEYAHRYIHACIHIFLTCITFPGGKGWMSNTPSGPTLVMLDISE